jgi:hypothetical protein
MDVSENKRSPWLFLFFFNNGKIRFVLIVSVAWSTNRIALEILLQNNGEKSKEENYINKFT